MLVLARCEFIERKENILALGNSGTGKTHIAWLWVCLLVKKDSVFVSPPRRRWRMS